MTRTQRWNFLIAIFFCLLAAVDILWLEALPSMDRKVQDAIVRHYATTLTADPDVVILDIDRNSLNQLEAQFGRYPFPRIIYADLIHYMEKQNPRAIVFDIVFSGADPNGQYNDEELGHAAQMYDNVFFASFLNGADSSKDTYLHALEKRVNEDDNRWIILDRDGQAMGFEKTSAANPYAVAEFMRPIPEIEATGRTGIVNFIDDEDGVGRRHRNYYDIHGWRFPALTTRVAEYLGFSVPGDEMKIHWKGDVFSHEHITFTPVLMQTTKQVPTRPQNEFTDKIVVIGSTAPLLSDLKPTPIDALHPGVEIVATVIDNLKNQEIIEAYSEYWLLAAVVFLIALVYAGFYLHENILYPGFIGIVVSAALLGVQLFATTRLVHVPLAAAISVGFAYYFVIAIHHYLIERKQKLNTISLFSRFLDPNVVKDLVNRDQISPDLEASRREVSVLFSDIRGFTTLSESCDPEEIVNLLNRYFGKQVRTIFNNNGTLDKFIGDAIMAFWGAPADDPDHAIHAVSCALEMADNLKDFNINIGIGIHTGTAVVGLIGSEDRVDYTVIGDTVNLASRIEGQTKGRSCILVSEETMKACKDVFRFEAHGSVTVKGRSQPVQLYEPMRKET